MFKNYLLFQYCNQLSGELPKEISCTAIFEDTGRLIQGHLKFDR